MKPSNTSQKQIRAIAKIYAKDAAQLTYAILSERQIAPWATLSGGTAGIAYALSRPDSRALRLRDRETAERLLAEASRRAREHHAWKAEDPSFDALDIHKSMHFGKGGVEFVRALAAVYDHAGEEGPLVRAFARRCKAVRGASPEFVFGVAGFLAGALIVDRARSISIDAPARLREADALAEDLLSRARGDSGWTTWPKLAFAHGRAGIFHALLSWSLSTKRELPSWLFDDLAGLASDLDAAGVLGAGEGAYDLRRSWCNGAGGLVLLWARAYEATGVAAFRTRARKAARFLLTNTDGESGDLCCGLGGRSYAFLAMDRIEPGGEWEARAVAMSELAVNAMLEGSGSWPNGLLRGFPGLLCLAADLAQGPKKRLGFPLVEG